MLQNRHAIVQKRACLTQAAATKVYWIIIPFRYIVYLQYIGWKRLTRVESLLRNACVVTSDFVTARIGWPEARGGPCEERRLGLALNRARVAMRGFQSGVDSLLARCGGRAGNTRTLQG